MAEVALGPGKRRNRYLPSFQTIAFFVEEAGEYGEQELMGSRLLLLMKRGEAWMKAKDLGQHLLSWLVGIKGR